MSILSEIMHNKRSELQETRNRMPLAELKAVIRDAAAVRSFRDAIRREPGGPVRLIAELKKASPSQGLIRSDFSLPDILSVYNYRNVAAISVLTERRYFGGELHYLREARNRTDKPLLRKDFIFDPYQVYESRANHADAVLLIAAALEKSQMTDLFGLARELSLDCLVEVRALREVDSALSMGAGIIGINNRDLHSLRISLGSTFDMLKDIPGDRIVVSESGIETRGDVKKIEATRVDAILVGTAIMKSEDMGAKIDELMGG